MKLCSYLRDGKEYCGFVEDGSVFEWKGCKVTELLEKLTSGSKLEELPVEKVGKVDELHLLLPVPNPKKILGIGFNFRAHVEEMKRSIPEHPSLFVRFADSLVGHNQAIWCPDVSQTLDWEGELAVIIGKRASRVRPEQAMEFVAGYSCFGEHSVREFQMHATQATAGKNFRNSGSFGPWIVTKDEIADIASQQLTTYVNGSVMQQSLLSDMIFDVNHAIAYITQFTDLYPGDVIAMGTPSGVGLNLNPQRWLKPGDLVEIEISNIGKLSNRVITEPQ